MRTAKEFTVWTLNENYLIEADQYNFTLMKRRLDKKTGEAGEAFGAVGHFGKLSQALEAYRDELFREMGEVDVTNIDLILLKLEDIQKVLEDAKLDGIKYFKNMFVLRGKDD